MVCLSPVGVCSDEGLTLETSARHHIPQAKNIPYQPLLIKPIFLETLGLDGLLYITYKIVFKTYGFQIRDNLILLLCIKTYPWL